MSAKIVFFGVVSSFFVLFSLFGKWFSLFRMNPKLVIKILRKWTLKIEFGPYCPIVDG